MLRKITIKFFLLLFLFSFTSCFEIIEEIDLKNNGPGDMTLTLNLSKSKSKVASLMLLEKVNGYKVPSKEEIEHELNEIVNYLKKSKGISNVTKKSDFENYIFTVSCSFKNMANINDLLEDMNKKQKNPIDVSSYSFNTAKKYFKRKYTYSNQIKDQYKKLKLEDRKVFNDAFYTTIYRFENQIAAFNNKKAKLSKSKKALMLKTTALDLINGKTDMSNTIQLKK